MAPAEAGRLLRAALLAATAVSLATARGVSANSCGVAGCTFTGGCRETTAIVCDFRNQTDKEVSVIMKTFPESITSISIANANGIEIEANFVKRYGYLKNITFVNISTMVLPENSLNCGIRSLPLVVTIDDVAELALHSNVFTNWHHHDSEVVIRNVNTCFVGSSSFSPSSVVGRVLFANISSLILESGAFKSNISNLMLSDCALSECSYNTFGGHIGSFSLQQVQITDISQRCVSADHVSSLIIRACNLPRIRSEGFKTTVDSVLIETSRIGIVESEGFKMSVSTLLITESSFEDISSDFLAIVASESIVLDRNNVTALREDAFRSLQVQTSLLDHRSAGFNITSLSVTHADNGSFRFSSDSGVSIHSLSLFPDCVCNVHRLAQQLVHGHISPSDNQTAGEKHVLESIRSGLQHCSHNNSTLTMCEFFRQHCSMEDRAAIEWWEEGKAEVNTEVGREQNEDESMRESEKEGKTGIGGQSPKGEAESDATSPLYALIAIPLVVAGLVAFVLVMRRRSETRRGFSCGVKPLPADARECGDGYISQPSGDAQDDQDYCEVVFSPDNLAEGSTVARYSCGLYEEVQPRGREVAETDQEDLYEEMPIDPECNDVKQTLQPLYAQSTKRKANEASPKANGNTKAAEALPIYAQVVKRKADVSRSNEGRTNSSDGTGVSAQSVLSAKESGEDDDTGPHPGCPPGATSEEMPVYAVVSKAKGTTKKPSTNPKSASPDLVAGEPSHSTLGNGTETAEQKDSTAVYAVVNKDKKAEGSLEVGHQSKPAFSDPTSTPTATSEQGTLEPAGQCHADDAIDAIYSELEPAPDASPLTETSSDVTDGTRQDAEELLDNPLYGTAVFRR